MSTSSMPSSRLNALLRGLGGLAAVCFTAGCTAELRAERPVIYTQAEADVVYTESAPVNIETYPREQYAGVDVYLVGGRWYRRHGSRWQTYRTEPVELGRRRGVIERRAPHGPPAHHDKRGHDKHDHDRGHRD